MGRPKKKPEVLTPVEVGQIWERFDKRMHGNLILIEAVHPLEGEAWTQVVSTGRKGTVALKRFHRPAFAIYHDPKDDVTENSFGVGQPPFVANSLPSDGTGDIESVTMHAEPDADPCVAQECVDPYHHES